MKTLKAALSSQMIVEMSSNVSMWDSELQRTSFTQQQISSCLLAG